MPAPGSYAFSFLEQIRAQMNEIEQILQIYSTKGAVKIETLPPSLVSFPENDYSSSRTIIESLQRRYHVLCSQEFLLVMAHKDEEAVEQLLKQIRAVIAEIERTMHKHRTSRYHTPLPKSLLSCYSKSNGVDMKLLEKRFEVLKDQEFQIMVMDMRNATTAREAQSAPGSAPIDHTAILAAASAAGSAHLSSTSSSSLPVDCYPVHHDLPPSFQESQSAYT
ncbi:hypothetical protein CPC16_002269 [Podila verticillata]|nr:hypothetical protein CPC16_002269 [Podila verticillata]KAI9232692.1 MAG: hypothetical protein BYD32DRAFT_466016 [Podila humilis]KFH73237.1 hypothetical protein MVEG_00458 [Podila verticillata NRRL 6337]